jgi:hypothetical protein
MVSEEFEFQIEDLELEQTEVLDAPSVARNLDARMKGPRGGLKKLDDEAKGRGYRPVAGPKGEVGLRQKFRSRQPVRPPKGEKGQPVREVSFDFSLRALEKPDSLDQAAIATVTVSTGPNQSEEYDLLLEAPGGNFGQAREFKVENDQVRPANSWWTAAQTCATSTCGATCVNALLTCTGNWAEYLLCLATRCGLCWAKCTGCATCNCSWTCRWAIGCCRQ